MAKLFQCFAVIFFFINNNEFYNLYRSNFDIDHVKTWLNEQTWQPESMAELQTFFNNAARSVTVDGYDTIELSKIPDYRDLQATACSESVH